MVACVTSRGPETGGMTGLELFQEQIFGFSIFPVELELILFPIFTHQVEFLEWVLMLEENMKSSLGIEEETVRKYLH